MHTAICYAAYMRSIRKHSILVSVVVFLVLVNVLYFFIQPDELVDSIGVHNTYLVAFLIAAIGGLSTITGTVLFTALATFAAGGSDPLLLGLVGGAGIFISDSIFFYLATLGRRSVPEKWESWIGRIDTFVKRFPRPAVLTFVFLYLGFSPLPNDLLMLGLVLGGYRYREIVPALLLGSITIALIVTHIGGAWFVG